MAHQDVKTDFLSKQEKTAKLLAIRNREWSRARNRQSAKLDELYRGDKFNFDQEADQAAHVFMDATIRRTEVLEARLPSHPVEDGFDIGDNSQPRPRKIRIRGIITGSLFTGVNLSQYDNYHGEERANIKWELFESILLNADRVVMTRAGDNGTIKDLYFNKVERREDDELEGFTFNATLKQVKRAETKKVTVPRDVLLQPVKNSAQSEKSKGQKGSSESEDGTSLSKNTILRAARTYFTRAAQNVKLNDKAQAKQKENLKTSADELNVSRAGF